ncbi:hypothetical protein ACFQZE_07250 [Paenibacillus sp. GCM10027627]|uniref:hypothetical protein n=1 Tax=unclassified Paenibacillus TaxID=185978 RepID=UPI003627D40D
MRHFTISAKGHKGYRFAEMGYMYQLDVDMFGKTEDFYIYADNRQAAIKTGETIVSTIAFESITKDVQNEVNKQNGLQQLKVAYKMLETHEDKEKVLNYIQRLKSHFNIVDEVKEEAQQIEEVVIIVKEEHTTEETNNVKNETPSQEQKQQINTYTAFNRTFSTYNEAYTYCIQSDFDPSYITTEEPRKTSQNTLRLDLQLFSSDTIEEPTKPFKQPYASYKNGVSKFGIGKHLELIYTLETTGKDPNYDEINYSNIKKYEFDNLESLLKRFNLFQQHGYQNLQIWMEIRYKDETIIENGTHGQLEFMVNDSRLQNANQTTKENERLKNELSMYKAFIEHYKALSTFEKFIKERQQGIDKKIKN